MMTVWRSRVGKLAAAFLFLAATLLLLLLMPAARRSPGPETGSPSGGTKLDKQRTSQAADGSGIRARTKVARSPLDALGGQTAQRRRSSAPDDLDLRVSGNHSFTTSELLTRVRVPDHPTQATIEETVREQLRSFYQSRGYVDIGIDGVTASDTPPWKVRVQIEEGVVYTLAEIEIQGGSVFNADEIRGGYPEVGGVVDWPRLRRADANLAERYRDAGFLDAKVAAKAVKSSARSEFRYKVRIEEGRRYRIRSIRVPSRFLSNNPFRKGDVFHPDLLTRFLAECGLGNRNVVVDRFPGDATVEIAVNDPKSVP